MYVCVCVCIYIDYNVPVGLQYYRVGQIIIPPFGPNNINVMYDVPNGFFLFHILYGRFRRYVETRTMHVVEKKLCIFNICTPQRKKI